MYVSRAINRKDSFSECFSEVLRLVYQKSRNKIKGKSKFTDWDNFVTHLEKGYLQAIGIDYGESFL